MREGGRKRRGKRNRKGKCEEVRGFVSTRQLQATPFYRFPFTDSALGSAHSRCCSLGGKRGALTWTKGLSFVDEHLSTTTRYCCAHAFFHFGDGQETDTSLLRRPVVSP
jgi:hypothetical protein